MKHLQTKDYLVTPWKNGKGVTAQIAIHPEKSSFKDGNFDWRLSSAEVSSAGDFSSFPGFERLLVIWDGSGVFLNETLLPLFTAHHFNGEEEIYCELIKEKVKDLGLIFRPDKVEANFQIIEKAETLKLLPGDYFLFSAYGEFEVEKTRVRTGECLMVVGPTQIEIHSTATEFKLILVRIFQLR